MDENVLHTGLLKRIQASFLNAWHLVRLGFPVLSYDSQNDQN